MENDCFEVVCSLCDSTSAYCYVIFKGRLLTNSLNEMRSSIRDFDASASTDNSPSCFSCKHANITYCLFMEKCGHAVCIDCANKVNEIDSFRRIACALCTLKSVYCYIIINERLLVINNCMNFVKRINLYANDMTSALAVSNVRERIETEMQNDPDIIEHPLDRSCVSTEGCTLNPNNGDTEVATNESSDRIFEDRNPSKLRILTRIVKRNDWRCVHISILRERSEVVSTDIETLFSNLIAGLLGLLDTIAIRNHRCKITSRRRKNNDTKKTFVLKYTSYILPIDISPEHDLFYLTHTCTREPLIPIRTMCTKFAARCTIAHTT